MQFRIGDRVSVLDSTVEGKVVAIDGPWHVLVETDDGFEESYEKTQLLKSVSSMDVRELIDPDSMAQIILEKEKREHRRSSKPHIDRFGRVDMEIDLHIEALLDNFRNLSNAEILNVQLTALRNAMDKALAMDYHRLIVIHGVGEGILRSAVEEVLSEYQGVEFFDANYKEYGLGATEVRIH
jgi:hypothetical protein